MKKFMMLAALLAGGVPSLWAHNTAILRSIANTTDVEFTYHAPDGRSYNLGPYTKRILEVELHDSVHTETKSKSHFISKNGAVILRLDYQKSVQFRCPPNARREENPQLQQRLWLALNCVTPAKDGEYLRYLPIFELDSGLKRRPIAASCSSYDLHLTLSGEILETSYIEVVETNALAQAAARVPKIPAFNMLCLPHNMPEKSPRLESPHLESPRLDLESPRLVESPR